LISHFSDVEAIFALKDFFNGFGCSALYYEDNLEIFSDFRQLFLLNTTIASIEVATIVLLLGTNLRTEAPLLNSRLRKNYLLVGKQLEVYSIGLSLNYLTFPVKNFGNSFFYLRNFFEGRCIMFKNILFRDFVNGSFLNLKVESNLLPKIFIGVSLLKRLDSFSILNSCLFLIKNNFKGTTLSNSFNIVSP